MFEFLTMKERLKTAERNYKETLSQQQVIEDALIELAIRSETNGEDISKEDSEQGD